VVWIGAGFVHGVQQHVGVGFAGSHVGGLQRLKAVLDFVGFQGRQQTANGFSRGDAEDPSRGPEVVEDFQGAGIKRVVDVAAFAQRAKGLDVTRFQAPVILGGTIGQQSPHRFEQRKSDDMTHGIRRRRRLAVGVECGVHGRNNGMLRVDEGTVAIEHDQARNGG